MEATARQGLEFESVTRLEVDGRPAVGATGTQTARGAKFNKAIVAFPSEGHFVTLTATLEPDDPVSADAALAVLRQARWVSEAAAGSTGFTITPAKGYEKQASSVGLVYTLDGDSGPGVAQFLVQESKGASATPASGRRDAARARFAGLPGSPEPTTEREVDIAGLPGVELTGAGKEFGLERRYYAAMLFTDDGYVLLAGTFDPDRYPADQTPAFRAMGALVQTRQIGPVLIRLGYTDPRQRPQHPSRHIRDPGPGQPSRSSVPSWGGALIAVLPCVIAPVCPRHDPRTRPLYSDVLEESPSWLPLPLARAAPLRASTSRSMFRT